MTLQLCWSSYQQGRLFFTFLEVYKVNTAACVVPCFIYSMDLKSEEYCKTGKEKTPLAAITEVSFVAVHDVVVFLFFLILCPSKLFTNSGMLPLGSCTLSVLIVLLLINTSNGSMQTIWEMIPQAY